ncbi:MAG: metallophosphoesterase family protein [Ekhidna sp.]|nr:metallophosphoesterase family protein [Ekhidna sp.]MBC6426878.1 metallophosphoesterase family protein [Ekhidna sp.]
MKIGLIADTHGFLDIKVFNYFECVDEIWHAGDIGTMEVLEALRAFKPTMAVWGNIDGERLRVECREEEIFEREGVKVLLTHIAAKPPKYNKKVSDYVKQYQPKLLVCGHSHILKVMTDTENKLLFMNPGAAGRQGFHKVKTLLRFDLEDGEIKNPEVIELGPRGKTP